MRSLCARARTALPHALEWGWPWHTSVYTIFLCSSICLCPLPSPVLTSVEAPYAHDYLACITCEDRALLILYPNLVPRAKWEGIALGTRLPSVYHSYQKSPKSINLDEILSFSVFLYLCTPCAYDKSRFSHYCQFVVYPHFLTVYCWSSSFAWWRRALLHAALRSITKWLLWGKWETSPIFYVPQ